MRDRARNTGWLRTAGEPAGEMKVMLRSQGMRITCVVLPAQHHILWFDHLLIYL